MPLYEYTCHASQVELLIAGQEQPICPECGSQRSRENSASSPRTLAVTRVNFPFAKRHDLAAAAGCLSVVRMCQFD